MLRTPTSASLLLILFLLPHLAAQDQILREAARLDADGKCEEAERIYQKVLAGGPPSVALLNNLGIHYLLCGQPVKAQTSFERLLKINPMHENANLQLARIAADQKRGAKALEYLAYVKDSDPAIRMLRAEALHWAGQHTAAVTTLEGLQNEAKGEPSILFPLGATCYRIGMYVQAEAAFNAVLTKNPGDFDVLFNLGRAAARAQHYERAQGALEVALRQRPDDADTLSELGRVHAARQDYGRAVYLLAQARQRAPGRPDILLALARAAEDAGYYGDSALAYDEYLQLQPGDDTARRDRALVYSYTMTRTDQGLKELAWYVKKHPDDPVGYFNLAQLSWRTDPQQALGQLSAAVQRDPNYVAARFARAWLLHRLGRATESLPDLEAVIRFSPENIRALDQLGLTLLSLDKPSEAERILRRALAIAPEDPEILMHLGRALMALDREAEAQRFLNKFQKLRRTVVWAPRQEAWMIESATLSAAERMQRETERLRRDARNHPGDAGLRLHFAELLLTDGKVEEASAEFRTLLTLNADSQVWEEAGRKLLRAEQYKLAREFLERAAAARPAARLDLAIALFFTDGPGPALKVIEGAPEDAQLGDYLLMKARILDAKGETAEAQRVLYEGLRHSTTRPDVARQAALLLVRQDSKSEALQLLSRAERSSPDDADLLLMKAIVLGLMGRDAESEKTLKQLESRWPEWDRAYIVHGLLLERQARTTEARQKIQTAIALSSPDLAPRCAAARLARAAAPDPKCSCLKGLYELLFPACVK